MTSTTAAAVPGEYRGTDKLIFGIVLAVVTFWLFAQTTLNVAPTMRDELRISKSLINIAVSITALFSGIFFVVAGSLADRLGRVKLTYIGLLGLFAVVGTQKALGYGLNPVTAPLLGMLTGIGGGMLRDVLVAEIPNVLRADLYAALDDGKSHVRERADKHNVRDGADARLFTNRYPEQQYESSDDDGGHAKLDSRQLGQPIVEHLPGAEPQIGLFHKCDPYTDKRQSREQICPSKAACAEDLKPPGAESSSVCARRAAMAKI